MPPYHRPAPPRFGRRAAAGSVDRVEEGQVGAEVVHRRHLVAPEPRANVACEVLQRDLRLRQGKLKGDRPVDRGLRDEEVAVGDAGRVLRYYWLWNPEQSQPEQSRRGSVLGCPESLQARSAEMPANSTTVASSRTLVSSPSLYHPRRY